MSIRIENLDGNWEEQTKIRKLEKQLEARDEEIGKLRDQIISGMYEDEYPIYTRGEPDMELQSVATAEEVNALVQKLKDKDAEIVQLHQAVLSLQTFGPNDEAT